MNRRSFNRGLVLAVPALGGVFWPLTARAVDPATVAATAQLASGVLSFMSRGSDPTVELIVSITKMLEAVGKKIDAIDQKLDVLSDQVSELRALLTDTPKLSLQQALLSDLREPWNSFVQAYGQRTLFNTPNSYLKKLNEIYGRQQVARTKFLEFSKASKYDGLVSAALAYDAESSMVVEILRVATSNNLVSKTEPALLRAALLDYKNFFSNATLSSTTGGPAFLLTEAKRKVEEALKVPIEIQTERPISAWFNRPSVSVPLSTVIGGKVLKADCGREGQFCLQAGKGKGGCAEPGEVRYLEAKVDVSAEVIADTALLPLDELKQPFLYRLSSNNTCENGQNAELAAKDVIKKAQPRLDKLNQLTITYYNLLHVVQVGIFARKASQSALQEFDAIYRT